MNRGLSTLVAFVISAAARAAHADTVVQVPVDALLDGRPVTTLTDGALVSWTVGVDQNDGFITTAAATYLKQSGPALPDDGHFPADATHPEIALHFANAASATSPQAHALSSAGSFDVALPRATYSKVFLILTSSVGDSPLTVTLSYADATSTPVVFTLPDWGTGKPLPTDPPIFFNLISGLHKWDKSNMSVDTPSHSITGVVLSPASDKELTSIHVNKTSAAQVLQFWGATGIATSSVGGDTDAGAPDAGSARGGSGGGGAGAVSGAGAGNGGSTAAANGGAPGNGGNATAGSGGLSGSSGTASATAGSTGAGASAAISAPNASGSCAVESHTDHAPPWGSLCLLGLLPWRRAARRRARGR